MKARWIIYYIIATLITFFLFYYVELFCGIYLNNSVALIQSSIISLIIEWVIVGFGVPILITIIREIVKRCTCLRYFILIYNFN